MCVSLAVALLRVPRAASRSPASCGAPQPRLLLPRYTPQDIFHVFSMFLDEQEFTYTSSVLAKALVARGFAAPWTTPR